MANHVLLNNVQHHDLKVLTGYGAEYGDNVATVLTFPTEFADVQREYPILFQKDSQTGEYRSIVLLGFEKSENLFLNNGQWNANYVPAIVARGPFLIGFQEQEVGGNISKEPVIHVDLDNPRISRTEGTPVFLPRGGNSSYIDQVAMILNGIRQGLDVSKEMFAVFSSMELIEPVNVEIKFTSDLQYDLQGLYTISQEKLAALDGESLARLNKSGFLQGAFLAVSSLSNLQRLVTLKQQRLLNQATAS
jgi:SapC